MEKLDLHKRNLRKFGITMGVALPLIALVILFLRHKDILMPCSIVSAMFFLCAWIAPNLLKPVYITWMKLAFILGWINTRVLLLLIFYLIFTPIGLVVRLLGKDLLDKKFQINKPSYWIKKEALPRSYEKQF